MSRPESLKHPDRKTGKGSSRRPLSVPKNKFDTEWDRIFGKTLPRKVKK